MALEWRGVAGPEKEPMVSQRDNRYHGRIAPVPAVHSSRERLKEMEDCRSGKQGVRWHAHIEYLQPTLDRKPFGEGNLHA